MTPSTFTYGPWLPDLANVGQPVAFGLTLGTVPTVDCLNMAYANGNYFCVPSPVAAGPTLSSQILGAYTWYDNSAGKEMVFAGLSGGISALIDGAWSALPFFNSLSVAPASWKAITAWGGFINAIPWVVTTTLGAIGTKVTGTFNGTLVSATFNAGQSQGYFLGTAGSLTPSTDPAGNTVRGIAYSIPGATLTLTIEAPGLGQSYFTTLAFPSLSRSYASSAASYSTSGGNSLWVWNVSSGTGLTAGTSYPVTITT